MTRAGRTKLLVCLLVSLATQSVAERWVAADFGSFDADLTFYDPTKNVVLSYFREPRGQYWRAFLCSDFGTNSQAIGWWLSAPDESRPLLVFAYNQSNTLSPAMAQYELPHTIPPGNIEWMMRLQVCRAPEGHRLFEFTGRLP